MDTTVLRIGGAVLLALLIYATGYWMKARGKLNGVVLNVHKLLAVAAAVLLGVTFFQVNKAFGVGGGEVLGLVIAGVIFLATIITGGLVSARIKKPKVIHIAHRVLPHLTIIASAVILFLLVRAG